jgi:hypothetical protein
MSDTKPIFFISHNDACGIDGPTLGLAGSKCPGSFKAMSENQPMNITHAVHLANDYPQRQVGLY